MIIKLFIIAISGILAFLTFQVPFAVMWENSGFFEVWSFWILIFILIFWSKIKNVE